MKTEGAILVQYVFLDVVRFTQGRTIEAQIDVVDALNAAVSSALETLEVRVDDRILLPTGDGLALALLQPGTFDLALTLAQTILKNVGAHNSSIADVRRQFDLRIGVNQNIDNLVTDINGNRNIAGRGINQAQRIMSNADGRQILLGDSIYDILCEREAYDGCFRPLPGRDKHGNRFTVYQLIRPEAEWLDVNPPAGFRPPQSKRRSLSDYQAHYIANAPSLQAFLLQHRHETSFKYNSAILVHLLSLESLANIERGPLAERAKRVDRASDGSPYPTWRSLESSDFWVKAELVSFISDTLREVSECFEAGEYEPLWAFPTDAGLERVKIERPDVWSSISNQDVPIASRAK